MKPTYGYCRSNNVEKLVAAITERGGFAYAPCYPDKKRNRGKWNEATIYPFGEVVFIGATFRRESDIKLLISRNEWYNDCIFEHEIKLVKFLNDTGAYNEAIKRVNSMLALIGTKQTIENPIHPFSGFDIDVKAIDETSMTGEVEFMGKKQLITVAR